MKLYTSSHHHVTYQHIHTSQFKTRIITVRFFAVLSEKTATLRALTLAMMKAKNAAFPSRKTANQHLESLYDATLHGSSTKLGTQHINQLSIVYVAPRYANDDTLEADVINYLRESLVNPDFDQKTLEEEKRFLRDYFDAEYANKTRYAQKRHHELLHADHPYKTRAYGDPEAIDAITLEDVSACHRSMLTDNHIYVTTINADAPSAVEARLAEALPLRGAPLRTPIIHRYAFTPKDDVYEVDEVSQDRVFLTYQSGVYYRDADYVPMLVFNHLLGEGSDSLLFNYVRETLGLAYYIYASYSPNTGLVTLASGMSANNVTKGIEAMRETLQRVIDGDFTDADLDLAKTSIKSGLKQSYDSPASLSLRALRTALFKVPFKEEALLEVVDSVSKQNVMRLASALKPVFYYRFGKEHGDADH